MKKLLIIFFALLLMPLFPAYAEELTLAWDANAEEDLAGYKIYYSAFKVGSGESERIDLNEGASPIKIPIKELDGSKTPLVKLTGAASGITYMFTITAYNKTGLESGFSNMVAYTVDADKAPQFVPPVPPGAPGSAKTVDIKGLSIDEADVLIKTLQEIALK